MLKYRGKRYIALRGEELDPFEQMSDEALLGIEHNEFVDLVDDVLLDLDRMETAVKRRKELYDRLRKIRLSGLLVQNKGAVAEAKEMLFQLTDVKGTVQWSSVVKTLRQAKPELTELLDELEEQHRSAPTTKVLKHRRRDEPKTWKKLPHVPLRQGRTAQSAEINDMAEMRLMKKMNRVLNQLISGLQTAVQVPVQRAAVVYDQCIQDDIEVLKEELDRAIDRGDEETTLDLIDDIESKTKDMVLNASVWTAYDEEAWSSSLDDIAALEARLQNAVDRGYGPAIRDLEIELEDAEKTLDEMDRAREQYQRRRGAVRGSS